MPVKIQNTSQKCIVFRFYGNLNELLTSKPHKPENRLTFKGRQTVKHLVESLGVPHTEVGLILLDGQPVDFGYIPQDGERLAVYPHFSVLTNGQDENFQYSLNEKPRFLLDGHLGRLAAFLRMLGFDAQYDNRFGDEELTELAYRDKRILLTRDRGLLKRKKIENGCCLLSLNPREQLLQVARRYGLKKYFNPFTRCMACNGELRTVSKQEVLCELEPKTKLFYNLFMRCQDCKKIYWAGSHHDRMQLLIKWLEDHISDEDKYL